ncbi:MAG TPA: heterodisulfide reductase-related iron-sulfur binding cluster [Gammaproteobacteria bacterium]|jgi:Fe-S oxidoreductase
MSTREGSLEAPTRHPLDWRSDEFYDQAALDAELERVFDICHSCRRCFSLCNAFPTLFDLVDESESGELDTVPKSAYGEVVEHCYLCDMCYMTKCPYVPPHEWNVDFPHLMLRAKARHFRDGKTRTRDKLLSSTDTVGKIAGIPVVAQAVNALNSIGPMRSLLESTLGVARDAPVPKYHSRSARKRNRSRIAGTASSESAGPKLAVFTTCYGNRNQPDIVDDLIAVLEHNDIEVCLPSAEHCCGMPKLELGDLESVAALKDKNIPVLYDLVRRGWSLTACIPSCVLMFKQELPLLFPDDDQVRAVADAFFDPFDFLMQRHRGGELKTDFSGSLGQISYQVPCHLRVQNIGLKTRDVLELVPETRVKPIERCSGHDGTYAVKREYREISKKIARPVARQVDSAGADHFTSDCPMAAEQIASVAESAEATHPIQLLRRAYGI